MTLRRKMTPKQSSLRFAPEETETEITARLHAEAEKLLNT
jgi:hypothetical protein